MGTSPRRSSARRARGDLDRQRQGLHQPFGRNADRGALRQDLSRERDHPSPHAPPSPTTTGKIERFHRTLRREFLNERIFASLDGPSENSTRGSLDYNTERPHQRHRHGRPRSSDSPGARSRRAPTRPRVLHEDRSGDDWVSRTVSLNGTISVANQVFSVGKHRSGTMVDIHIPEKMLEAWDGNELLKAVLRQTKGVIRKKHAEQHAPHKPIN